MTSFSLIEVFKTLLVSCRALVWTSLCHRFWIVDDNSPQRNWINRDAFRKLDGSLKRWIGESKNSSTSQIPFRTRRWCTCKSISQTSALWSIVIDHQSPPWTHMTPRLAEKCVSLRQRRTDSRRSNLKIALLNWHGCCLLFQLLNQNNLLGRPSVWETIDHIDLVDEFPMISEGGIGDITLGMTLTLNTFLFQAFFNGSVHDLMPKRKPLHQSWQQPSLTPFNDVDCFRTLFGFQLNQHIEIEQSIIQRSISLKKKFWNGGAIVGLEIDSLAAVATSPRWYGFSLTSDGN